MQASDVQPIVSRSWLDERLAADRPRTVIADVRWYLDGRSGHAEYERAHVPGSVWIDVDAHLSTPSTDPTDGRHPFPRPERFAIELGLVGIGDHDLVVALDDTGGMTAGRLVWMLRVLGRPAALLDGGLDAFAPAELVTGPEPPRNPVTRTPIAWPAERFATADELVGGDVLVVDVRAEQRFTGEAAMIDPRPGHIPGAINLPWQRNLATGSLRFPDVDVLRARFAEAGLVGRDVVASCGSGVSACHLLVAMEHAGLPPGRLFPPSWSGWSADPARSAALGPA
jgi:thiosulfate/3-mercaptopyruvate sulfurtransferase